MKLTVLTILLSLSFSTSFSQDFNKSIKSEDFKLLQKNGILLVETGNEELNETYKNAMETYWTFSEFRTINLNEDTPNPDDIVLIEVSAGSSSHLFIMKYDYLNKKYINELNAIGSISFNGFLGTDTIEAKKIFINQMIIGLNDICTVIKTQKISGKGTGLNSNITKAIMPNLKSINGKTLLIVGENKSNVHAKGIKKSGLKYKYVSLSTYQEMLLDDMSDYCLLYTSLNRFRYFAVFDFEENQLSFIKQLTSGGILSNAEFSTIVKNW
jgi:hypothetical protein